MSPRVWRRASVSVALSVIVHLLLLLLYQRLIEVQRQEYLRPTRYLPDLLLLVPQAFRATSTRIPTVAMEQTSTPAEVEELAQDLAALHERGRLTGLPITPVTPLSGLLESGARALEFQPIQIDLDTVDLEQGQFEAVQRLRDLYGSYSRIWLPDPDTTDQQSVLENRARAIVAAALESMGGTEKLLKIHSMDVLVWIVAWDHLTSMGIINVSPYPYPVGIWRFDDTPRARKVLEPFAINIRQSPLPGYATYTPARSRGLYYQLYEARWLLNTPPPTRKIRDTSEGTYWHIAHRFLDEGVRLGYLGTATFAETSVHRIHVEDSKYGRTYEAYFDRKTALLIGIREELSDLEKRWFRQKRGNQRSKPPVYTTHFDRYEDVEGVLIARRWRRTDDRPRAGGGISTILLNVGLNGAQPDSTAPELW